MIKFTLFFVFLTYNSLAQDSLANVFFPKEFLVNDEVKIYKHETISPQEKNEIGFIEPIKEDDINGGYISKTTARNSVELINESYQTYNFFYFCELNKQIQITTSKFSNKLNLSVCYRRDLIEMKNTSRYVIMPELSYELILMSVKYSEGWYIYDQVLKIRYLTFPNLNNLLNTLVFFKSTYSKEKLLNLSNESIQKISLRRVPFKKD